MAVEIESFIPYITLIGVFIVIATISYNLSRKITKMELENEQLKSAHREDIKKLEIQIQELIKEFSVRLEQTKSERREEISKATAVQVEHYTNVQKQIDSAKADVKSLLSKIEVNETKINVLEDTPKELKVDAENSKRFFTDWNQRIEDRIETLRKEFITMFTSFHGDGDRNGNRNRR